MRAIRAVIDVTMAAREARKKPSITLMYAHMAVMAAVNGKTIKEPILSSLH
jgi:hypothetical protein